MENYKKICPKCKTKYTKKVINCESCNITLMKLYTYAQKYDDKDEQLDSIRAKIKKEQNQQRNEKILSYAMYAIALFTLIIIASFIISAIANPTEKDYTCERCYKTYSDLENETSIARTNFCVKCYDDYLFVSEAQKELENW